jgi:tRNA-2-methylthio-N6-dimethylallyladenosine synthase
MAQILESNGLKQQTSPEGVDLVIVNSCSVRAKPEHKAISEAGRYQGQPGASKKNKARIIMAGCLAQQEGKKLLRRAPYLDAIIGPDNIQDLWKIVESLPKKKSAIVDTRQHSLENPCFTELAKSKDEEQSKVANSVTIMKGCDNYCSYCVVPYVRGPEVSRPLSEILGEVEQLARRGYKEVMLLGQNVNSYQDQGGANFCDLLEAIEQQAVIERIRFISSHPKDASVELAQKMAQLDRVCEHIHFGLQSGSSRILKLMNRKYTKEQFIEMAKTFRDKVDNISITTDIIVGFPTETEEDFEETLDVVRQIEFDQAFSFHYSPRPQTAAAKLDDDVSQKVKLDRLYRLQEVLNDLAGKKLMQMVGRSAEVLVEGRSLRDEQAFSGRTRCNRVINFESRQDCEIGSVQRVDVLEVRGHTLWGRI